MQSLAFGFALLWEGSDGKGPYLYLGTASKVPNPGRAAKTQQSSKAAAVSSGQRAGRARSAGFGGLRESASSRRVAGR